MVNVASEEGAIDEMSKKQIKKRGEIFELDQVFRSPEEEYKNSVHLLTLKNFSEKISSGVSKIKQMLKDEGYNI